MRRGARAGETVPTWLERMPRRPEWNAPPSESRTSVSPYQLRSIDGALGGEQVERALEARRRRTRVHDEVAAAVSVIREGEVDAERRRDVRAAGIDVHEGDLHGREPAEQSRDAAADHPGADDRDPVADERGGVPQRVDGGLDGAGEHGAGGWDALRHDRHGAGGHDVGGLVRVEAEDGAAAQLGRPLAPRRRRSGSRT